MYETIPYDDICRLCISHSKSIDIFSTPPDLQIYYSDIIQILIQINIAENELKELPKGICNECAGKLLQFYNFKTQTEDSQLELIKLLEENSVTPEVQELKEEIEPLNDSSLVKNEPQDEIPPFYESPESFEYELNSSTNIVNLFNVSSNNEIEYEEQLLKEKANKLFLQEENFEEYSIIEENAMENDIINNITNETSDLLEENYQYTEDLKYDSTPKFTLIENTEQLPADEQFLWQKKLSKWVTKLPRGRRKLNNNNLNNEEKVKKVFQCEICGRLFSSKASERNHQTVHTGEKNFECEICHKRFTRIYHVKDHLRIHQGIQPYKCDICGKCFTKNSDLHRHKRIHSNKAMYTCQQCGKEYKWKTSFDIHLNSHTGIKAFKCTKCNNAYTSGCSLKKHQIKYNHL